MPLACEIYASTIHPQFSQGTQCSVVSNLKPSSSSLSSSSTRLAPPPPSAEFLAMTPVSTDNTPAAAAAADSSEDENNNGLYFGLDSKHVKKSMALPIPNATTARHYHRPIASSSSSSVEQQRTATPHAATPSTSTTNNDNNNTIGEKDDYVSTSLGANSSVGSLSSLFSRNSFRQNHSRRPRNNLAKTKSSFILRVSMHDHLQKILSSRTPDDIYVFYNQGTSFIWADGTQKTKVIRKKKRDLFLIYCYVNSRGLQEHLCKIVFSKAYPTCHDVNKSTCTGDYMDIIIGFSSGDLVWLDPISNKYSRLNKGVSGYLEIKTRCNKIFLIDNYYYHYKRASCAILP